MRCPDCQKSTLRKAAYCHHCGTALTKSASQKTEFLHTQSLSVSPPVQGKHAKRNDLIVTTGLIWGMSLGGCWLAGIDPAWSVVPGLVTLIGPTIAEAGHAWVTLPKPPREQITKIQAEHIDEQGRPRSIYDFDDKITLDMLVWVADAVVNQEKPFSRRGICEAGRFSQGNFYTVRDEFLRLNYAFYKNPTIPNEGIILTPRCLKLLKKVLG